MTRPLLLLCCVLTACGGDARSGTATVRDSAGISLVTSSAPAWGSASEWSVDTTPALTIGHMTDGVGSPMSTVTAVRLLADGRLAVSSNDEHAVMFFDAKGNEVGRSGREGSAPGEFRQATILGVIGDSLVVWDGDLDRGTVIGTDGALVRTFQLRAGDSTQRAVGFAPIDLFADGSLLLAGRIAAVSGTTGGLRRDPIPLRRAAADGAIGPLLATVPSTETIVISGAGFVSSFERPFGRRTVTATRGSELLFATNDADLVARVNGDGKLAAIMQLERAGRAVQETDVVAFTNRRVQQLNQLPPAFAKAIAEQTQGIGFPAVLPPFDGMLVDPTGAVWLRDDVGPVQRDSIARSWTVLAPDGTWLGRVVTPRRLLVHQITKDRVIGVWRDEKDIEHVRSYRLRR